MGDNNERSKKNSINRRELLRKGAGGSAAAIGVTAFSGTSLAGCSGGHIQEAVFCGCSQVCVCGSGRLEVLVAHETEDGFSCNWVMGFSDTFCYEPGDGKVLAVKGGDGKQVVCNPNEPCAGDALAECAGNLNCVEGQSGGPCGNAFLRTCGDGEHPGKGQDRGQGHGGDQGRDRGHRR